MIALPSTALPHSMFGIRRDGSTSSSSATELVVTILGELMGPLGGSAWTQTFTEALRLFGVEDKAARQALARLGSKGWIEPERVGRRTRWHLTPWAASVLERGAERIYGFGQGPVDWDGQWLVLLVSVPEARRAIRARLNVRLGWAGFGSLGQGVWICPWITREPEVTAVLAELEIDDATLFRSKMTDVGNGVALARQAWEPGVVAERYEAFLEDFSGENDPAAASMDADETAIRSLIALVHAWRRFPLLDPDLPPTLLPADWPGHRAATCFRDQRALWRPTAASWWTATNHQYHPR